MTIERLPQPSTFEKARRKEIYRRFGRLVGAAGRSDDLLPLDEVRDRLRLFEQSYVGIRPIPVDKIVGSAGRSRDFDANFLPRRPETRERWKRVEQAFPEGGFPPIIVYELEGSYFVVDGHHRVAIAKQRGVEYIDAEITKLRSHFRIPPGADIGRIILLEQQRMFMEESGLDRARPEARIEFSNPQGYLELLELVHLHGYYMMRDRGVVLPIEEIAADWYDHVYLPAIEAIRREGLVAAFPRATEDDLFLGIYQRRRALFPERGGLSWDDVARSAREEEGARLTSKARKKVRKIAEKTLRAPIELEDQ